MPAGDHRVGLTVALASEEAGACRAALAGYGCDYLPEDAYAEWAMDLREQLLLHLAALCEPPFARRDCAVGQNGGGLKNTTWGLATLMIVAYHAVAPDRRRGSKVVCKPMKETP